MNGPSSLSQHVNLSPLSVVLCPVELKAFDRRRLGGFRVRGRAQSPPTAQPWSSSRSSSICSTSTWESMSRTWTGRSYKSAYGEVSTVILFRWALCLFSSLRDRGAADSRLYRRLKHVFGQILPPELLVTIIGHMSNKGMMSCQSVDFPLYIVLC